MKHITRDTINALMSNNRKYNLKKCGYSDDDIKDGESLYNALSDCLLKNIEITPKPKLYRERIKPDYITARMGWWEMVRNKNHD